MDVARNATATHKRPPLKRLLHEDDYLPIVLGASSLNVAGARVERTGRHLLLCRVEGEPSEAEIACALLQGGEHGSAASLSLPLRMDPHAFQFGMPAPDRPQCAHRNYPSVDVVDEELAADLDVARLDVIEISVQRFPIRSLYQGARPSEGEFVEGSNLGLVGAKKTLDQPTQSSASPFERQSGVGTAGGRRLNRVLPTPLGLPHCPATRRRRLST